MNRRPLVTLAVAVALAVAACGGSAKKTATASAGNAQLVGLFRVTAGACAAGGASGSWFRMLQPNGKPGAGPFVSNGDSPCPDKTWSPLLPGTDGGLLAGSYQPEPGSAFDGGGNGVARRITEPTKFFAVTFALSTNATDPQTAKQTVAPRITVTGTKLSGDLRAFAASWNGQHFNQGSPKPDGTSPGSTAAVSGTYDSSTRHFTLEWASQIVGGPFNNFTGLWHLEGTFEAKG